MIYFFIVTHSSVCVFCTVHLSQFPKEIPLTDVRGKCPIREEELVVFLMSDVSQSALSFCRLSSSCPLPAASMSSCVPSPLPRSLLWAPAGSRWSPSEPGELPPTRESLELQGTVTIFIFLFLHKYKSEIALKCKNYFSINMFSQKSNSWSYSLL